MTREPALGALAGRLLAALIPIAGWCVREGARGRLQPNSIQCKGKGPESGWYGVK